MKKTILLVSLILTLALLCVPAAAYELCEVHGFDYHSYDGELIDYVGNDAFMDWVNANSARPGENGCPWDANIYRFIHDFGIPQAVFEDKLYRWGFWNSDYPVDLLYGADAETVDAYYRDYAAREAYLEKKVSHMEIRFGLLDLAKDTAKYRPFYEKYVVDSRVQPFSVADFVRVTGIAKEDLRALLESWITVEYPGHTKVRNCFPWDFDLLYELAAEPEKTTPLGKINEDLLFCGQPAIEETVYAAPQTGDANILPAIGCIAAGVLMAAARPGRRKRTWV